MKTNKGLVEYAEAQLGLPYWYGTFGNTATAELYAAKKKQYPKYYDWTGTPYDNFPSQYGKRVHDCVGLVKGYLWSETPASEPLYIIGQDVSANGMRAACTEKGDIGTMPDIQGVLVFMTGHVGVYIGGGCVIEARGHEYGVVKTGICSRPWKWWGKCPFIEYENGSPAVKLTVKSGTWNVRAGAGTNYRVVCVVRGGSTCTASKTVNGWYFIDRLNGWISGKGVVKE